MKFLKFIAVLVIVNALYAQVLIAQAAGLTVNKNIFYELTDSVSYNITSCYVTPIEVSTFGPDGNYIDGTTCEVGTQAGNTVQGYIDNYGYGTYKILFTDGGCNSFTECKALWPSPQSYFIISNSEPIGGMIDNAQNGFMQTTGDTVGGNVSFVGDNFVKVFMGGAFALIAGLMNWFVALVMISVIVYFAYRAFRFFRT